MTGPDIGTQSMLLEGTMAMSFAQASRAVVGAWTPQDQAACHARDVLQDLL